MQVTIGCPTPGGNINVTPTGSGTAGTICASGSITWDGSGAGTGSGSLFVQVIVSSCPGGVCPGPPDPTVTPGTSAPIIGSTFCAIGVSVPSSSVGGDPMIAFAWVMLNTGSGVKPICQPGQQQFNACQGNPSAIECCALAPCSGSGMGHQLLTELASAPALHVAVPGGAHAGLHVAAPLGELRWLLRSGSAEFVVAYCSTAGLVIRGDAVVVEAEAIEIEPLTVVFGGHIFGIPSKVVVTVA